MTIKAIETEYKGYRFRSRLEARWAVFFEEHGTPWQYEVEGFELPSGKYLPDFYLPTEDMYVEVKPPEMTKQPEPPQIYMAGRMGSNDYRPLDITCDDAIEKIERGLLPRLRFSPGGLDLIYTGPYSCDKGNHCGVHGVIDDGAGYENEIFKLAIRGIRQCDIFFAMFEDLEAFGTLIEVGYAKALNKAIIIGFNTDKYPGFTLEGCGVDGRDNPMWFAAKCADSLFVGSRPEILTHLLSHLQERFPAPREHKLARELSEQTGNIVSVVYGDPVAAFENKSAGVIEFYRGQRTYDRPNFECWSYSERDGAARKARQARFEHGQSGALT